MKTYLSILVFALFASVLSAQKVSSTATSSSKSAISVSSDNVKYSYSARFDKDKFSVVKDAIRNSLGKSTEESNRSEVWKGKDYNVSLRQRKVKMEMNKAEVSKSFRVKFEDLGEQISKTIGSVKPPTPPKIR